MTRVLLTLLIVTILAAGGTAYATTYYVAKSGDGGNNANNCTQAQSISTPKLTISAGLACMTAAGDTLNIRTGTYSEGISGSQLDSGTDYGSGAVTIQGYQSEVVTLTGGISIGSPGTGNTKQYIIFKNLVLSGSGFFVGGGGGGGAVHHIKFDGIDAGNNMFSYTVSQIGGDDGVGDQVWVTNSKIHDCESDNPPELPQECHGIYVEGDNNLIENTEIYDVSGHGIHNYAEGSVEPSNNVYRNLHIHGTGTHDAKVEFAILLMVGTGNVAYNNLVISNQAGIRLYSGNAAYNNTLYGNGVGYGGECCDPAIRMEESGTIARNNILYANVINSVLNNGGTASNNITANPSFVNAAGGDFHLTSSSTNAIDQGFDLSGTFTTDYDGNTRDSDFDIGAFEFIPADTEDPVATITAPTSNTTYATATTPMTTLAGGATDNVGVSSVTWANAATSGSGSASGCSGQTSCSWSVSSISLNEGSNAITVTATDAASNDGTDTITVTLDSTAPSRSSGSPSGALAAGTTSTSISLTTNETATCKYGTSAGVAYASLPNTFSSTNSTSHSTTVSGLSDGGSYTYYVRCQDGLNNANTSDFTISFSVEEDEFEFPGTPTSLTSSAASNPTFPGTPTSLTMSASATITSPGLPTSLTSDADLNPAFPDNPTGLVIP